jgi:hypothetical protein
MLHLKKCEFSFNHRKENLYNIIKKLIKNTRDACLEPSCKTIKDTEDRDEAVRYFEKGYSVIEHRIRKKRLTTSVIRTIIDSEAW